MSILDLLERTYGWEPMVKSTRGDVFSPWPSNPGEAGVIEPNDITGDVFERVKTFHGSVKDTLEWLSVLVLPGWGLIVYCCRPQEGDTNLV